MARKGKEASTRAELARLVGRHASTVGRWMKRNDWPFGREGPWNVADVIRWADGSLGPDNRPGPPPEPKEGAASDRRAEPEPADGLAELEEWFRRWDEDSRQKIKRRLQQAVLRELQRPELSPDKKAETLDKLERYESRRLENEKARGRLLDAEEERERDCAKVAAVAGRLSALPRSLAGRLVGKGEREIREILADEVDGIRRFFADDQREGEHG